MYNFIWKCYNVSGTSCKLLDADVTCQERLASYLRKALITTYQERLASYLKMLQRIKTVLQVSWKNVTTYQEWPAKYLLETLQCSRKSLPTTQNTGRYYTPTQNPVQNPLTPLLDEDATTYQDRLVTYLTKMLQCTMNILQLTWRKCYNVSGTSCTLLEEDVATYQERLATYLQKTLQRSRASFLTTQSTGPYYTPQKMCKSDSRPAHPWAPSPQTTLTRHYTTLSRTTLTQFCHTQLLHAQHCHTELCHRQLFHTAHKQHFQAQLFHAQLFHKHAQLCNTTLSHNFVTHMHTQPFHTPPFYTQLFRTQLCDTTLSHRHSFSPPARWGLLDLIRVVLLLLLG